jgi:archaellum component FlaC
MSEEPTNADLLAAIERLGTSVDTRLSGLDTRLSSFDTRLSSVEKTVKDTNATIDRMDIRLKSVEATVNEISILTGVNSKAIGTIKADLEALEARVKKLEDA